MAEQTLKPVEGLVQFEQHVQIYLKGSAPTLITDRGLGADQAPVLTTQGEAKISQAGFEHE